MDIGSIMLIASSGVLVGILLIRPFFARDNGNSRKHIRTAIQNGDHEYSSLLAEKERILTALRELDFDNQLGKIPPEEYTSQRSELLHLGAAVIKKLDHMQGTGTAGQRIETPVNNHREDTRRVSTLSREENDELEDLIALHRNSHKDKAAGFCPKCGKPVHKTDQFCPRCGAAIQGE